VSRRCRHEHVVEKYNIDELPDPLELSYRECLDCDEWLPMGPARDDGPHAAAVAIEIRAAEIAAAGEAAHLGAMRDCEGCGWDLYTKKYCCLHSDGMFAGWLARAIVEHGES